MKGLIYILTSPGGKDVDMEEGRRFETQAKQLKARQDIVVKTTEKIEHPRASQTQQTQLVAKRAAQHV